MDEDNIMPCLIFVKGKKRHSGNPALRGHPESDSGQARMTFWTSPSTDSTSSLQVDLFSCHSGLACPPIASPQGDGRRDLESIWINLYRS